VAGRWHDPSQYRFGYDAVPDGVINIRDMMQIAAYLDEQCQSASGSARRQRYQGFLTPLALRSDLS